MKTRTLRLSQAKQNKIEKTAKIMLIGCILCCAAPFLYLFSMQMSASASGITIMQLVDTNPLINLNMIAAFTNPFVGYMLFLMRKKVMEMRDFQVVYLNLSILMIAQILTMNVLYLCLCAYVLYKVMGLYERSYKESFKGITGSFLFKEVGGSIIIGLLFLMICLLTVRLNFLA